MYNITTVENCLLPTVTLDANISKHAPTYLTQELLISAFPRVGYDLSAPLAVTVPITAGIDFVYEYDGDFGDNPDVKVFLIQAGKRVSTVANYELSDDNTSVTLIGDFRQDQWEMVLSPSNPVTVATNFNTQLEKVIKGSISKMLYLVVNKKKLTTLIRSVIADFKLFDGRADYDNKNANLGRFCFLKIKAKNNNDLVTQIKRVSFQIDMICPDLKLYLYCDDTPGAPVKVIPTPYEIARNVTWYDTLTNGDAALNLPSLNDDDTTYYLGYYETDLAIGAQSIKKVTNFNEAPNCTSCSGNQMNAKYFKTRTQYVDIKIGYVDAQNLNGVELPDMDRAVYVDRNNFGMNIDAVVTCDISNFICGNKNIFVEPLAMQAAIDLLQVIIHSERVSVDLNKSVQGAIYILNGNSDNNFNGLLKQYAKMIDALDVDTSTFSEACLPCSKKPAVIKRYV